MSDCDKRHAQTRSRNQPGDVSLLYRNAREAQRAHAPAYAYMDVLDRVLAASEGREFATVRAEFPEYITQVALDLAVAASREPGLDQRNHGRLGAALAFHDQKAGFVLVERLCRAEDRDRAFLVMSDKLADRQTDEARELCFETLHRIEDSSLQRAALRTMAAKAYAAGENEFGRRVSLNLTPYEKAMTRTHAKVVSAVNAEDERLPETNTLLALVQWGLRTQVPARISTHGPLTRIRLYTDVIRDLSRENCYE